MKNLKFLALFFTATLFLTSCSSDDDNEPINEEEVITTLNVALTGGSTPVTLSFRQLDESAAPTITVSGDLDSNTTYTGAITVLNELENPADNITLEIEEEDDEHQFFYQVGAGLNISNLTYEDFDVNGNPLGLEFSFQTGEASEGNFTIILKHEPNKDAEGVSNGDITNAGGETDIEVIFPIKIKEVVTTLNVDLTGGSTPITLTFRQLDESEVPTIIVSGDLDSNTTYTGTITVLNELENPPINISEKIDENADKYQFFYQAGAGLNISNLSYLDFDGDGNPLGLRFSFDTGEASSGNFTITLRHEPNKDATGVSDGQIANAGGETDIEVTFPLEIQ